MFENMLIVFHPWSSFFCLCFKHFRQMCLKRSENISREVLEKHGLNVSCVQYDFESYTLSRNKTYV